MFHVEHCKGVWILWLAHVKECSTWNNWQKRFVVERVGFPGKRGTIRTPSNESDLGLEMRVDQNVPRGTFVKSGPFDFVWLRFVPFRCGLSVTGGA